MPHAQELLEGPLGDIAIKGWALTWTAMRRRKNEATDAAATEGVYMAARMANRGENGPRISITRYDKDNM